MGRVELNNTWEVGLSINETEALIEEYLVRRSMELVSKLGDTNRIILAKQGAAGKTRLLGGWFVNQNTLPKQATFSLEARNDKTTKIDVTIEETMRVGVLDSKFKWKYMEYFQEWMEELRNILPLTIIEETSRTQQSMSIKQTPVLGLESELQKAAKMLKDGLIDEEEYKALKKKLIEKS